MSSLVSSAQADVPLRVTPSPAILVDGLVKRYGTKYALDGITFEVGQGEVFALLGPNGAGKTTTVEILEGYRRADGGHIEILGLDPESDSAALKQRIGVMLQEPGLYLTITPREALDLFCTFYSRSRSSAELLALVGLQEAAGTRYRLLSGGQKRRLALALALVGRPDILFLDEPTAGLDPQARRATWDIVNQLSADGVAVLLTTHYLEEAERLAHRVAILDHGSILAMGTPAALMHGDATTVRLRTDGPISLDLLRDLVSARTAREEGGVYEMETDDAPALLVEVTTALHKAGISTVDLRVGHGSLEDVFVRLTGREFRE